MNIERLRKIIEFSTSNKKDIEAKIKSFYLFAGMSNHEDVLNIMQIVRSSFQEKGYLIFEIPFADKEIGALCYKGDSLGYIVLNTSLPKVNVNFALCHEVYHVFYQENELRPKVEFANEHYYEHEEEFSANLFAGMLLMPEASFRFMYHKFKSDSNGNELDTMLRLVNYYQAPYMSVLIRCHELGLPGTNHISEELLLQNRTALINRSGELWLDTHIWDAPLTDDYIYIEALVKRFGTECIENSYLNERSLKKVLQNMQLLYSEIKGE